VDVVECGLGAAGSDYCDNDPAALCIDNPSGLGFTCVCPDNYFDALEDLERPGAKCVADPPDECALGADDCDPLATCVNEDTPFSHPLPRGYRCECPKGHADVNGDGTECVVDGDECADQKECDDDPDACVDGVGSYSCVCPDGYTDVHGDGSECAPITSD
jgi:hypothetical protein